MTAQPSTNAQIHLNETLLVLFTIVLIIILGLFVYYRVSIQHVTTTKQDLDEQEATVILASITRLPELACPLPNCIDTSKLLPFATLATTHASAYRPHLGAIRITIDQLYPLPATTGPCTRAAYAQTAYPANCRAWTIYDQTPPSSTLATLSTPVTLYYPETDTYGIGRLHLGIA